jgi:hypothetical protein
MKSPIQAHSPDFLVAELQARGLHYLIGPLPAPATPRLEAHQLLAELAIQQDARLRSALIPLFLQQPYLASALPAALALLSDDQQKTLKVYYTAAVLLQAEYQNQLTSSIAGWRPLPDLFSSELGVDALGPIDARLQQLGAFHTNLAGLRANWPGTYRHAAERLINRLLLEARWAA